MSKLQAIIYSIIYLVVIAIGLFIFFKAWWAPGYSIASFGGLVAFFLVSFGCMFLSISLTRIIINSKIDFGYYELNTVGHFKIFQSKVGKKKAAWISGMVIALFILLATLLFVYFGRFLKQYEVNQLRNFGQYQLVRITDIKRKGKGGPYAFFDYYFNGKKYSNDLLQKDFNIGDSVEIIFSTKNIDIIEWADEFREKTSE